MLLGPAVSMKLPAMIVPGKLGRSHTNVCSMFPGDAALFAVCPPCFAAPLPITVIVAGAEQAGVLEVECLVLALVQPIGQRYANSRILRDALRAEHVAGGVRHL